MTRFVRGSWWDGPRLRWDAVDAGGQPCSLALRGEFDWQVSQRQVAQAVPAWVFEPRRPPSAVPIPADAPPEARTWDPLCDQPHAVYLAFFGTLAKVGMTVAERLPLRLREQGADAGFAVAILPDRAEARAFERTFSVRHKVPEVRRAREVLPRLARLRDDVRIERAIAAWRRRLRDTEAGDVVRITDAPLARPLPAVPGWVPAPGRHAGRWLGALGHHVFYVPVASAAGLDVGGRPVLALRRQDLVGRWIDVRT
jgi:hypothetical protein